MTALEVSGLGRRLPDGRWLFRDLSLTLEGGTSLALVGESGAGKSTLLNLCAGLEPADEGSVRVAGEPVDGREPDASAALRRARIGFVFQAFHLLPHLDVAQNVGVPLRLLGVPAAQAAARVQTMLEQVGLGERARAWPRELSGGEQQRVALARALVHRPALVLADEPTGNLDPRNAAQALALLDAQVRGAGAALIVVTHSREAAAAMARAVRLVDGRLEAVARHAP